MARYGSPARAKYHLSTPQVPSHMRSHLGLAPVHPHAGKAKGPPDRPKAHLSSCVPLSYGCINLFGAPQSATQDSAFKLQADQPAPTPFFCPFALAGPSVLSSCSCCKRQTRLRLCNMCIFALSVKLLSISLLLFAAPNNFVSGVAVQYEGTPCGYGKQCRQGYECVKTYGCETTAYGP